MALEFFPFVLALCSMLSGTYYAQSYAGIIGGSLAMILRKWKFIIMHCMAITFDAKRVWRISYVEFS